MERPPCGRQPLPQKFQRLGGSRRAEFQAAGLRCDCACWSLWPRWGGVVVPFSPKWKRAILFQWRPQTGDRHGCRLAAFQYRPPLPRLPSGFWLCVFEVLGSGGALEAIPVPVSFCGPPVAHSEQKPNFRKRINDIFREIPGGDTFFSRGGGCLGVLSGWASRFCPSRRPSENNGQEAPLMAMLFVLKIVRVASF